MKPIIPYNQIKRDSNVIIYGAGKIGRRFWESNCQMRWFKCIHVVDRRFDRIKSFPCHVDSPEMITKCENYDYIIVAILNSEIRKDVVEELVGRGVDKKKIIFQFTWFEKDTASIYSEDDNKSDSVRIALKIHGGIGDHIVSLKLYGELIKQIPMSTIDVYGFSKVEKIFGLQDNLGRVSSIHLDNNSELWETYDLIIDLVYIPRVEKYNRKKFLRIDPELTQRIDVLVENNSHEDVNRKDVDVPETVLWRLMLERARLMGLNRYSVMGSNGFFEINDKKVTIKFNESFKKAYEELELKGPFITVNYGTDKTCDGNPQIKMWSKEYHEELNMMIKKNYPDLHIIQLGTPEAYQLKGVDRYILGEDLDIVKYILRDSLCHIDCEGGLVHMASQIGTKCFVLFGPTPMWFYGYEQNCNIKSDKCGECYCLTEKWMTTCIKYGKQECMFAIKPKDVLKMIMEFFSEKGYDFAGNK